MPGLALLGVEEDEERLDKIELWPLAGEGGWSEVGQEEGGPSPP